MVLGGHWGDHSITLRAGKHTWAAMVILGAKLEAKLGATVTSRAGSAVGEAGGEAGSKAGSKAGSNGNFEAGHALLFDFGRPITLLSPKNLPGTHQYAVTLVAQIVAQIFGLF